MTKEELLDLADDYADAETSFWFGQKERSSTVDTPARQARNAARQALSDAIDAALAKARMDALDILKKLNDGTYLDIASEISDEGWEAIDAVLKDAND